MLMPLSSTVPMTSPLSPGTLTGLSALSSGLQARPTLVLSFYPYGILLHRLNEDGGELEYAVNPAQLAEALAVKVKFETGLLTGNTLYITSEGARKAIIEYRPPLKTAIWLDGSETPLVIPLPGLILGRVSHGNDAVRYGVYAVKSRPEALHTPLFNPPLPNVGNGSICWGSVKRVSDEALASNRLDEDWKLLLGSIFTSHSVGGKSKDHPHDIRQQFIALEQRQARKYPIRDLIPARLTLGEWIEKTL